MAIAGGCDAESTPGLPENCLNPGTPGATSTCLKPTMPAAHYVEQAEKYFDTLDINADPNSIPDYSELVARWEWPPWLLLTGYGRDDMIETAFALHDVDPSTVPERDCRAFDVQPFARCYVVFQYDEGPCPIYEEFTFNDAGQMTFIEAWSDLPGHLPMDDDDRWAEGDNVTRLSTRIPGLGTPSGQLDINGTVFAEAAQRDPLLADLKDRANNWTETWMEAYEAAGDTLWSDGCGW